MRSAEIALVHGFVRIVRTRVMAAQAAAPL